MGRLPKQMSRLCVLGMLLVNIWGGARVAMAVEVGEPAPDFSLSSTTGERISLSQFRGKKHVLLEFYVSDFGAT